MERDLVHLKWTDESCDEAFEGLDGLEKEERYCVTTVKRCATFTIISTSSYP